MNGNICAPNIESFDGLSCIHLNVLIEMINAYNMDNPNSKIKMDSRRELINPKEYKKYLIYEFEKRLNNVCDSQICWTKQNFINNMKEKQKNELLKYTFKPEGPEGKFEWLNTINIKDVIKQYERKYPDFKFVGCVPIDFDDLPVLGIRDLNFNHLLREGKTKLGFVFNLDKHNQDGSHWIALYVDLLKYKIFFYDSFGVEAPSEVRKLIRKICRYFETTGNSRFLECKYNKLRHQFGNSECGVYSINFILRMLQGENFEKICNDKTTDEEINKFRDIYFIKSQ